MALNKAIIMGRITRDLELKQTPNGQTVLSFTVAVDRYSKTEENAADFISCVAWGKTAEFIGRYFGKGRMIAVTGNLHSRTYDDKNGVKHYVTEIWVDSADFTGEPKPQNQTASQNAQGGSYGGGQPQGYNYTTAPPQAPQTGAQPPHGYPSQYMCAPPNEMAQNTADEYAAFQVFGGDGIADVPF